MQGKEKVYDAIYYEERQSSIKYKQFSVQDSYHEIFSPILVHSNIETKYRINHGKRIHFRRIGIYLFLFFFDANGNALDLVFNATNGMSYLARTHLRIWLPRLTASDTPTNISTLLKCPRLFPINRRDSPKALVYLCRDEQNSGSVSSKIALPSSHTDVEQSPTSSILSPTLQRKNSTLEHKNEIATIIITQK